PRKHRFYQPPAARRDRARALRGSPHPRGGRGSACRGPDRRQREAGPRADPGPDARGANRRGARRSRCRLPRAGRQGSRKRRFDVAPGEPLDAHDADPALARPRGRRRARPVPLHRVRRLRPRHRGSCHGPGQHSLAGGDGADDGQGARLQRQEQRPPPFDFRAMNTIDRFPLGKTSLQVTRLGLGSAPLGGLFEAVTDDEAHRVVEAAWRAGIRFFDTAPLYGHGLAEHRLGMVLKTKPRHEFVLATKVGRLLRRDAPPEPGQAYKGVPPLNPVFDFSYDGVMRSVEESLTRLGLDRVDVLHIHDPDDHFDEALTGAYRALDRLRTEGSIRAVGAGMNQSEMLVRFAREANFDCFLLAGRYTVLDRSGAAELLPLCAERRIAIIAGGVFNSGILADP